MIDLPPPEPSLQIVLASEGMSKGLKQTDGPQLLVRGGVAFGPVAVEAYGKNVLSGQDEGVESGLGLALRRDVAGFSLSARAGAKWLVWIDGPVDDNAFEFQVSASRRLGPVRASATVTYSPDDLGSTGESLYYEAGLSWQVRPRTRISGGVGHRERDGGPDYASFNGGITQQLVPHVEADLHYYSTDREALGAAFHGRLVASLKASF